MRNKKVTRGISSEFAERIAADEFLQKIYNGGKSEIIWGIRNNYVNLYYNSDSIAKVKPNLSCEINEYYFTGKSNSKNTIKTAEEIYNALDTIKQNSNKKTSLEKNAQQKLVMLNNANDDSNWYCVDIEYVKAFHNKEEKQTANFSPRFDIIAVSKAKPHRVALIELKYGKGAYVGVSGIKKHIQDFYTFKTDGYYNDLFKQEILKMLLGLKSIGANVPVCFDSSNTNEFAENPEFYFITLDNNADGNASTPKQTCGGYLFENNKKWNSKRFSKNNIEKEFGDITLGLNEKLYVKFLFSRQDIYNLSINDIVDGSYDEG